MQLRLLLLCFLLSHLLTFAQEVGQESLSLRDSSTCAATTYLPLSPDSGNTAKSGYRFNSYGLLLERAHAADRWRNIPPECRIDWGRKREHFLMDWLSDLGLFFNTFDTTYVARNRYDFMFRADNINFFQNIRLSASDAHGRSQSLLLAPAHAVKIGPYGGWRWLTLGWTFGIVPDRYGSRTNEFNIASYSSKVGFDLNYTRSSGNFNLLRATGFEGVESERLKGQRLTAMTTSLLALNFYYVFNYRHFSYPAAFSMSTVQLKSAGSWMAGLRYDKQDINFDAAHTEALLQSINPDAKLINSLRITRTHYEQVGFSLGYAYNWVPRKQLLISASAAPSIGYRYQEGETLNTDILWRNIKNFHMDFIFRLGLVWTTGRYYAGGSVVSYLYDYRLNQFQINNNITYLRFYFGLYFRKQKKFRGEGKFAAW